jgi:hypothetical protein
MIYTKVKSTMLKPFAFPGMAEAAKGMQARKQAIAAAWTAHLEDDCSEGCKVCEADQQMVSIVAQLPGLGKG